MQVMYMEGIKYVNLIENSPVVIGICGVENGDLAVPTYVPHVFLGRWHMTVHGLDPQALSSTLTLLESHRKPSG